MNAVVALCHFCEMHGPSVMMCTQPFQRTDAVNVVESRNFVEEFDEVSGSSKRQSVSESESDLAESDTFEVQDSFTSSTCTACRSFGKPNHGCVTYGDDADIWYLTLQYPHNPEVFTFLRQACVRSLSSEISPGREGPILFGDDQHGYVYCYTFYLKDNEARGLQRWYSFVVLSMDKLSVFQSWPFLSRSLRALKDQLQARAEKTYNIDQTERPQRAVRLGGASAINPENFRRQRRGKAMRSLPDLTSDPSVFYTLHEHFTHLLQLGGNLMSEALLEGSPSCCGLPARQDRFGGGDDCGSVASSKLRSPIELYPYAAISGDFASPEACQSPNRGADFETTLPRFDGLVHIYRVVGKQHFSKLAHHIVIGNQVIVRGFHELLVSSVIRALETLIPPGCRKSLPFSWTYESPWTCNLLGLHPDSAVPDDILSSPDYCVVDVLAAKMNEMNVDKYKFITTPNHAFPRIKLPTYLARVDHILQEPDLAEEVAVALIINQQERLLSKAKVIYKLFRTESRSSDELPVVMEILHIPPEDNGIMKFWMTALSDEYKAHLKNSRLVY